jgi:peptidoglycan/xylan/chitin deacetylase (PgdA/CDA1 family)
MRRKENAMKQRHTHQRRPGKLFASHPATQLKHLVELLALAVLLATFLVPGGAAFAREQQPSKGQQPGKPDSAQLAATSSTWYFAEGSVGGTFQEFLTLFNPNATSATTTVTYLFQGSRPTLSVTHVVNANARFTVSVNGDVGVAPSAPQQALSAIVRSTLPIVAERPMYFTVKGISSGSDVLGATNANSATFYFAEGDARPGYYTWISILNPSSTDTAHVIIRYYAGGSRVGYQLLDVGPLKRATGSPNSIGLTQSVAIQVESSIGVVVERPLYFSANIPNAGGATTGAASIVGAISPGNDWLFAEGYTGPIFQEYLVLANFTYTDVVVHVKLMYQNGSTQTVNVTVKALSQYFFDVNNAFSHPQPGCTPTREVSAEVTADTPSLVVERLMYFHNGSQRISGGTDVIGEVGPASHSLYNFAEGFVRSDFQEFLTVQNPTSTAETAIVTLFVNKSTRQTSLSLLPHSRNTLDINRFLALPSGLPSASYEVSMSVQAASGVIVAERPMYFISSAYQGGSDIIGFTGDPSAGVDLCVSSVPPVSSNEIDIGNTGKKQVALTFDAGGDVAPASTILSILNRRGVHATWFFTGVWAQQDPVLVRQVADGGYEIGNHTATHTDLATVATTEECKQLNQADQVISNITGRDSTRPYFRPPYGSRNTQIRQTAANLGYRTVMWTIDTLDWQTDSTPQRILQIISDNLTPGAIILMHAGSASEAQALDQVITMLQGQGYQLVTITEDLA